MSISGIVGSSYSALQANQKALDAVSGNVANLNTQGYARLDTNFVFGDLKGVSARIERAADIFLDAAWQRSSSDLAGAQALSGFLDRAQALFGDPSGSGFVFSALDDISAGLDALSLDPSSQVRRDEVVGAIQRQFERLGNLDDGLRALEAEAASGVSSAVEEISALLEGISALNPSISAASVSDSGGNEALTEQGILIDRLSQFIDIRVQRNQLGAAQIRTGSGLILVGPETPAKTVVLPPPPGGRYGDVGVQQTPNSVPLVLGRHLRSGQLASLLELRDRILPDLSSAVSGFAVSLAESLNAASNQGSSFPPPQVLNGSNTGLLDSDGVNFSGLARIGITDSGGRIERQLLIDFDAGEVIDQSSGVRRSIGATIGSLVGAIDTALGSSGSASFVQGSLTISSAGAGRGVIVADDADTPARRAGRGFAHSFGLNDLVSTGPQTGRATGLSSADAHGFVPGGTLRLGFRDASGAIVSTVQYTVGGTSIGDLVAGLGTAVSGRGQVSLDVDGSLALTVPGGDVVVLEDSTRRGGAGVSLTDVFGLPRDGDSSRIPGLHADIVSGVRGLGVGSAQFGGVGTLSVASGDGTGVARLSAALSGSVSFPAAGGLAGAEQSVSARAARLAGHVSQLARSAQSEASHADAVQAEITRRRQDHGGVDLDTELVRMTTYQQAYSAASRMLQAAQELYDTLLRIV